MSILNDPKARNSHGFFTLQPFGETVQSRPFPVKKRRRGLRYDTVFDRNVPFPGSPQIRLRFIPIFP